MTNWRPIKWLAIAALSLLVILGASGLPDRDPPPPVRVAQVRKIQRPPDLKHWGQRTLEKAIAPLERRAVAYQPPAPQIDGDRLFADVERLSFPRSTESDRSAARTYIAESLTAAGWTSQEQPFEDGINIVAERTGTDPESGTILLGAHYDSVARSPGADDNASGVATLLEIARLLGPEPTPRTLKLVFFDLEELGMLGSFAFVAAAENVADVRGAIILDMLGYACHQRGCQHYPPGLPDRNFPTRGNFLAAIGDSEHRPLLQAIPNASHNGLPKVVALPVPLRGIAIPDLLRSDHAPFWLGGIGAVMLTDTANFRSPHYHRDTDTPDTLDGDFLTGSAQIVANATFTLLHSRSSLATGDR